MAGQCVCVSLRKAVCMCVCVCLTFVCPSMENNTDEIISRDDCVHSEGDKSV